ncbi:MAG: hypothetical protein JWP35_2980 [Caulobacter sp.]|nr:hypothetical protein [Caulobacter sp.]
MTSLHSTQANVGKAGPAKPIGGLRTFWGLILAAAIVAAGLGGATRAHADPVDLSVVDRDTGQPLKVWRHNGRLFVAGRPGSRYSLRVTNNTEGRVLVVLSVDGVNIISGETAGYDQRGYIFDPHETYDLSGWRRSQSEIAAFVFAPLPKSYAARTGRAENVGVIGMAVFDEKRAPPVANMGLDDRDASIPMPAPPPGARSAARGAAADSEASDVVVTAQRRQEKLGTGYGAIETSVSNVEPFERASSSPRFVRRIDYDSYANLVAIGVIRPARHPDPGPRPFPARPDRDGYVPDPPPER